MSLKENTYSPTLSVLEVLRDEAINASIDELRKRDKLTIALRAALRNNVPIEDLSAASGLTCDEIRRRAESSLFLGEDLANLTGSR